MNAVIEQLTATAQRIKREMVDAEAQAYEFGIEGDWCEPLRRLPFSCGLWRTFRKYDDARAAYQTELDKRGRWSAELEQVRQQLHEVEEERDPDTIDYAAYVQARAKAEILVRRMRDPHGVVAELKDVMDRANENWGRVWSAYLELKAQERMITGADFVGSIPGYNPKADALKQIRERISQFETPLG